MGIISEETRRRLREARKAEAGMTHEEACKGLPELPDLPSQTGETVAVGVRRPHEAKPPTEDRDED